MRLTFHINYRTDWGEALYLTGTLAELGDGIRMNALGNELWECTIEVPPAQGIFSYGYEVRNANGTVRHEWGDPRELRLDAHMPSSLIIDSWQDVPSDKPFRSWAFTECINRRREHEACHSTKASTLQIIVDAAMVPRDAVIAITGNCEALGNWNPVNAPVMSSESFPKWIVRLPLDTLPHEFEYKFVILNSADRSLIGWEKGNNRHFRVPELPANGSVILSGLFFENPLPLWRGAGTAIPVFSLRSVGDLGVGDFEDLKLLAEWAAMTGQQFIQLLPINDTTMSHTWTDSYPYTTNSTFALHPMYMRIDESDFIGDEKSLEELRRLRRQLNELPTVDYEKVNEAKRRLTRRIYERQGTAEMTSESFKEFAAKNDSWLMPYAAWCVLRDRYRTPDMNSWEDYAVYDEKNVGRFIEMNREEIDYVRFIQYRLDRQLRSAHEYAHSLGVAIKGDIPIGISRCSVDAWLYPELFNLTCTAGAPPDDFAVHGQNWGFPTYRWDVMARDNYSWWRARLGKMSEYFDAYRIDHVLGFFRIWQIPADTYHGILGVFCPALPLSPEEMASAFDFTFDAGLHTRPYITEHTLKKALGDLADEARDRYLNSTCDGLYELKNEFSTQQDIAFHFSREENTEHNVRLKNGLMDLLDEVLFIEDPYQKGKYHPRICGDKTDIFMALSEYEQNCFRRLYEDFFYHRHNEFWKEKALEKLPPLIDSTGMLCCAEDLGMIPECVPSVMDMLKILSLEIQRMPKEAWVDFGNPKKYPYLSVCSTSTHDMSGIRQWWEENPEKAQKFYNEMLRHEGQAPRFAEPWICREIIEQNLDAPSMLCILPLQDWLACDGALRRIDPREEQINIPAIPHHYWRYRMHLNLEQLKQSEHFNNTVRGLNEKTGR